MVRSPQSVFYTDRYLRHGSHWANFWKNLFTSAVKICHRGTLPKVRPQVFKLKKPLKIAKKHQRPRIAWVGQADFGKLDLNNSNHGGKCQHLSAKRDQFETRSIWNHRRNFLTFALSLWTDGATTTFRHFDGRAIHKLVILRYFNVFYGNSLQTTQL